MVGDGERKPQKGFLNGVLAQSYHLIEMHLGTTESVSLQVADAIEASQGLGTTTFTISYILA